MRSFRVRTDHTFTFTDCVFLGPSLSPADMTTISRLDSRSLTRPTYPPTPFHLTNVLAFVVTPSRCRPNTFGRRPMRRQQCGIAGMTYCKHGGTGAFFVSEFARRVRLPPSPRLRRTAVALAEAGQPDRAGPPKGGPHVPKGGPMYAARFCRAYSQGIFVSV
jgi:hypothetical protein